MALLRLTLATVAKKHPSALSTCTAIHKEKSHHSATDQGPPIDLQHRPMQPKRQDSRRIKLREKRQMIKPLKPNT